MIKQKRQFCRDFPIPYSLKDEIEKGLNQWQKQGIIWGKKEKRKGEYSYWAAPIILVPTDNTGTASLCQKYKQIKHDRPL